MASKLHVFLLGTLHWGLLAALGTRILDVSAVKHAHNAMRACADVFHTCSTHVPPMFHTCSTAFCTMFTLIAFIRWSPTPLKSFTSKNCGTCYELHWNTCGTCVEHVWNMGGT